MSRKPQTEKEPYVVPETATCPFTGTSLRIVCSGPSLEWRAYGDGFLTKGFGSKQELMYFLCSRPGKVPPFPKRPKIEIREVLPDPGPDAVTEEFKEKMELAREQVDRAIK